MVEYFQPGISSVRCLCEERSLHYGHGSGTGYLLMRQSAVKSFIRPSQRETSTDDACNDDNPGNDVVVIVLKRLVIMET